MMQPLAPALQYSQGRSFNWSGAVLVNAFAEKDDGDKRADFAIMATPGLDLWATVGDGPNRGKIECAGVLYVVSGNSLYSVNASGASVLLGAISDADMARMASNGSEVCIAAGGVGYVFSGGTLHTPLSYSVSDVAFADGFIMWTVQDTNHFIISALDDALTYDGLDIASVEGSPDNLVGVCNNHRDIMFFKEKTTEVWYNSGASDFPFARSGNAFIERGCFDRDSIVKIDNSVNFVGDDRIIYTMNGYTPQRISTHVIEYMLRDATYARGWTYTEEGHKFYVLEVDRGTVVFDHSTGTWHVRQSFNSSWWRCNGNVDAYGLSLVTDRANGNIYTYSLDSMTENGDPISVEIDLPTLEYGRNLATMYAFEMTFETGIATSAAPNPQAMLTYTDDGGHTWSNELWRSLGKVGETRKRAIWRALGRFRTRQIKIRMTDAARKLVISYYADVR